MVEREEPRAWKASLLGAKMVRSEAVLRESEREALVMAPPKAVRLNWGAVLMMFRGGWRKVSITWTMPPLNLRS